MARSPEVIERRPSAATRMAAHILGPLSSLRLTVVLMAMAMFLIFAGTLAQRDAGIWAVMAHYFRTPVAWIGIRSLSFNLIDTGAKFPFPGGWLIGGAMLVNLLAAHVMRFQITWKRSGILLIHSGLILLMLGELVTGIAANEGQMTLHTGGWSNYVEDIRTVELAVVDPTSSPTHDFEITIPRSFLIHSARTGEPISHEWLPFDVKVDRYMANAMLVGPMVQVDRSMLPKVTEGVGQQVSAIEQPAVSGTDPTQAADLPAAYVTLLDKQSHKPLATMLVAVSSPMFTVPPQPLKFGDETYEISLRFKRTYEPYLIHLEKFTHEVYLGTEIPKNFSSKIRLVDPPRSEDREVLIYMNHPLRYAGQTFYQAAFRGDSISVLQVVDNPGWMVPYIACIMITGGLLLHFSLSLGKYVGRKRRSEAAA